MGRLIVAESGVEDRIAEIADEGTESSISGLIIGQRSSAKDFISFLARTPPDNVAEEDDPKKKKKIEDVDPNWMIEHAKQVTQMLPGGINVLGIYFVDENDVFQSQVGMTHARKVLKGILSLGKEDELEMMVLHIHRTKATKKSTVKTLEISVSMSSSGGFKPADLKFEKIRWQKIFGNFILDFPFMSKTEEKSEQEDDATLKFPEVERVLEFVENVLTEQSVVLFDYSFRKSEDFLDKSVKVETKADKKHHSRGKKRRQDDDDEDEEEEEEEPLKSYETQIFLEENGRTYEGEVTLEANSKMRLGGKIAICAFVHPRATVGEAVDAVYVDISRSLRTRFLMHCDSLLVIEDQHQTVEAEGPVLHEPPRRILVSVPETGVCISDYLNPGETTYDSTESIKELFGFNPDLEAMDDEIEMVASPTEIQEAAESDVDSRPESPTPAMERPGTFKACNPVYFLLAVGVAIVSISLYYIMMAKDKSSEDEHPTAVP